MGHLTTKLGMEEGGIKQTLVRTGAEAFAGKGTERLIENGGDIGNTMSDLTSGEHLLAMGKSVVQAGIMHGVSKKIMRGAPLGTQKNLDNTLRPTLHTQR